MIIRIARIISILVAFSLLLSVSPAIGDGWFSSSSSKTDVKKTSVKNTKSQPSTLDKMSTGTKKFFGDVGDTLTLKKSPPPKKTTTPTNPWIKPQKEEPKKSWFAWPFSSKEEEPKKHKSPSEWLSQKRLDP